MSVLVEIAFELFAAVTTVPNAKVDVLGPEEIRVSWDPVFQDMVNSGILLGFKIYYRSDGEPLRTIILVENVVEHVIRELSELKLFVTELVIVSTLMMMMMMLVLVMNL